MIQQDKEMERVRGYLLSQGEKYSYIQMWPRLVEARLKVLESLQGVREEQARFKPADEEWSISEVALHVVNGSRRVARVVRLLADGQPSSSDRIDPPHEETSLELAELREQLLKDSVHWAAMAEQLPESPSFEVTTNHMFFGDLHSRAWYLFQRIHDLDHYQQIEAIKKSPGFP